ncbi:hypothetical protein Tco_1458262 [Tanacetum coccineum]
MGANLYHTNNHHNNALPIWGQASSGICKFLIKRLRTMGIQANNIVIEMAIDIVKDKKSNNPVEPILATRLMLRSARLKEDPTKTFCNPDGNMSIGLDDFDEMNDMWDYLDPGVLTNEVTDSPVKPEFLSRNNMVGFAKILHVFIGCHQFLIDFIILENVSVFVEKRLTEVLFRQPFKEQVGIIEDRVKGVLWFKIGDDKTMFSMPRAKKRFGKLTVRQHNTMGPILKISNEDKSRRIHQPCQKIKGFYSGCLELGGEYKHDQEVVDWIKRGHVSIYEMM